MADITQDIRTDLRHATSELADAKTNCQTGAESAERLSTIAASQGWSAVAYGFSQVSTEFRDGHGTFEGLERLVSETDELITGNTDQGATQPISERLAAASGKLADVLAYLPGIAETFQALMIRIGGLVGDTNSDFADTAAWQCAEEITNDEIPAIATTLTRAQNQVDQQIKMAANMGKA